MRGGGRNGRRHYLATPCFSLNQPEPTLARNRRAGAARLLPVVVFAAAAVAACTKLHLPGGESAQVTAGRRIFIENCSSCHNLDPNLDGSIGPAIAGSPRALIEARVLHHAYPPGYRPKRATHLMRSLPWLAPDIDKLTACLAAAQKQPG